MSKKSHSLFRTRTEIYPASTLPGYFRKKSKIMNTLKTLQNELLCKNVDWQTLSMVVKDLKFNDETLPQCTTFLVEVCKLLDRHEYKDICRITELLQVLNNVTKLDNRSTYFMMQFNGRLRCLAQNGKTVDDYAMHYGPEPDYIYSATSNASVGLLKLMLKFNTGLLIENFDRSYSEEMLLYIKSLR